MKVERQKISQANSENTELQANLKTAQIQVSVWQYSADVAPMLLATENKPQYASHPVVFCVFKTFVPMTIAGELECFCLDNFYLLRSNK